MMKKGWMIMGVIFLSSILLIVGVNRVTANNAHQLALESLQTLPVASQQYPEQVLETLTVYVQNGSGQPAVNAYVYAYTLDEAYAGFGKTGADGYTSLSLDPGTYYITAQSMYDNFYLKKSDVTVPGSISITTEGASQVTLTARSITNSPLSQSPVMLNEVGNEDHFIIFGQTDSNGVMIFYVSPGFYNVGMSNSLYRYCLYKVGEDLTNLISSVDFNMSHQPYAKVVVHHPFDESAYLRLAMLDAELGVWSLFTFDSDEVVISSNLTYQLAQGFYRTGADDIKWGLQFSSDQVINLNPYESSSFSAGGPIRASARFEDTYPGETVELATVTDDFGNDLESVYYFLPDAMVGTRVYPDLTLLDPSGSITHMQTFSYSIPMMDALGTYGVSMTWETGAYQGLIKVNNQFMVLPEPVSAVITPDGGSLYSAWDDTQYEFPAGTFDADVVVTHTVIHAGVPSFLPLAENLHFYQVSATYVSSGLPAEPAQPYTITIGYRYDQLGGAIESTLGLYAWNGEEWVREPTSVLDMANKRIVAGPDHFSTWGVLGNTMRIFMTTIRK